VKLYISKNLGFDQDKTRLASEFTLFCAEHLPIENPFEIHLVTNRKQHGITTTALYQTGNNVCKIYGKNRAFVDILRSIAHEMTHMMQDEMGLLIGNIRDAGGFHEDQANAKAGEIIKLFAKSKEDRKAIYETRVISENIKKPSYVDPSSIRLSGRGEGGDGAGYDGDLITKVGGKTYIGDPKTGLSPKGFWEDFRNKLDAHIKSTYPELGFRIANLGVTRHLKSAAVGGKGGAKIAGSKHGVGLAQDIYMHSDTYGKYTYFREDNKKLAKDEKFVAAVISFMKKPENSRLRWGGAFSSGKTNLNPGDMPRERGILELHHFEFLDKHVVEAFKTFEEDIKQLTNGKLTAADMVKSKNRATLYVAAYEKSKISKGEK